MAKYMELQVLKRSTRPALPRCIGLFLATALSLTAAPQPAFAQPLEAQNGEQAAILSLTTVPATKKSEVMLTIRQPGRFSIQTESATGVEFKLLDMIQGPSDVVGGMGARDGRLDQLLDVGVYKLVTEGAHNGSGDAKLSARPFRDAAPISDALRRGGFMSADLADLQQRSFWIEVRGEEPISIDAAGRSLQDMRLWRNGTDLSALMPEWTSVEPVAGRPLRSARLKGRLEPGLYRLTVYGGEAVAWTDGNASQPLHIQVAPQEQTARSFVEGTIGPLGMVRIPLPRNATTVRVDVPEPVPVQLRLTNGATTLASASLTRKHREPVMQVRTQAGSAPFAEISGQQGQTFRLQALNHISANGVQSGGPHWVGLAVAGEGGDELPATAILVRFEKGRGTVLASQAPSVGPTKALRWRFNLRGSSTILFQVTQASTVAVTIEGIAAKASITPVLENANPLRADGRMPSRYDLDAGWYRLKLDPAPGAVGPIDLTLGPPGLTADVARMPQRSIIPLGVQDFGQNANHSVIANSAPGLLTEPIIRPLSTSVSPSPLTVLQRAGESLEIPIRYSSDQEVFAIDAAGQAVAVNLLPVEDPSAQVAPDGREREAKVSLSPPKADRVVTLASRKPPPQRRLEVERPEARPMLKAGAPMFFDLKQDEQRSFDLEVAEGGLYRIETLGRLKTEASLSTAFLPALGRSVMGAGQNALIQSYLRAGRYRIIVKAVDSSGRVGIVARKGVMEEGQMMLSGETVRATLSPGKGVVFPVTIDRAGAYNLQILSQGAEFQSRVEDAEGWPLSPTNQSAAGDWTMDEEKLRLVILPQAKEGRVIARIQSSPPAVERVGHGPHELPLLNGVRHQWREPQGRDEPRTPDRWTFSLEGPANTVLSLSDGMVGELIKIDGASPQPIGKLTKGSDYKGKLSPGRYAVDVRGLGRNDRLDYDLKLETKEIQPAAPWQVELPASIPFSIAQDRVVNLTTFGQPDVRGVLLDENERVVERLDDRTNDWNLALSRRLAAGSYTLKLFKADPAPGSESAAEEDSGSNEGGEEFSDASEADDVAPRKNTVEVRLTLPQEESAALLSDGSASFKARNVVRIFPLQATAPDRLTLLGAQSSTEIALVLERRDGQGRWRQVGYDKGQAPLIAAMIDQDDARPWRVLVWTIDESDADIKLATRSVTRPMQTAGDLRFEPETLIEQSQTMTFDVASIAAPGAGVLKLHGNESPLLAGASTGRALTPVIGDALIPQSERLWLVRRASNTKLSLQPVATSGDRLDLQLGEGEQATIPVASQAQGILTAFIAESTFGQPNIDAGLGSGTSKRSAFALALGRSARLWNAEGQDPLRVSLKSLSLKRAADISQSVSSLSLEALTAQPVVLPEGRKRLSLVLSPGTSAIAGWNNQKDRVVTVWSGGEAVSRTIEGTFTTLLLVNAGDQKAPVSFSVTSLNQDPLILSDGKVLKRFIGAAGSLSIPVDVAPGARLTLAGAEAMFVSRDGRYLEGRSLVLPGPGELVLRHKAGLVAAWIDSEKMKAWSSAASRQVELPYATSLEGQVMAFALQLPTPVLVTARTNAPVILALSPSGAELRPEFFPAGAEFQHYLPGGSAELKIYSPHDGPLTGAIELTAQPVRTVSEGLAEAVTVSPGGAALFAFDVKKPSRIGVGLQSDPGNAALRLLDARGQAVGHGLTQIHDLAAGSYVLEARIPADAEPASVRAAVIGIAPPPSGPPQDITLRYLEMVGLSPLRSQNSGKTP
ncbi:hypothetical protein [Microvirga solisilvae]|uniref:hypothetical protein n=1 Tax=Microvirga solisilvae TaxID=2919498 RepID=UPI001FAFF9FA|nr:hypothetical protein [Microvirga solisilvae]